MSIKNTVLIIGATSGIGAGLARRIHAQGKKVIGAGRRQERLTSLAAERHGLETSCFDFSDLDSLPSNITDLTKRFPQIDTVIVCAAMQSFFNLTDETSSAPSSIEKEVTTNLYSADRPLPDSGAFLSRVKKTMQHYLYFFRFRIRSHSAFPRLLPHQSGVTLVWHCIASPAFWNQCHRDRCGAALR